MFINIKINIKVIIIIISLLLIITLGFNIYRIFNMPSDNKNTIKMDTSNYTNILKEVHTNLDLYIGHSILCDGYVYIQEGFDESQFVLARNMMICCPNDTVVVGFLCSYNNIKADFPKNAWVKIEGIINKYEFDGVTIPIIEVQKIRKTLTPTNITVSPPTI